MTNSLLNAAIAASLAATTTVALAAPTLARAESISVSTVGIDLASADGQRQLDRRIARAARAVCGMEDVHTDSRLPSASSRACYQQALRDARAHFAEVVSVRATGG